MADDDEVAKAQAERVRQKRLAMMMAKTTTTSSSSSSSSSSSPTESSTAPAGQGLETASSSQSTSASAPFKAELPPQQSRSSPSQAQSPAVKPKETMSLPTKPPTSSASVPTSTPRGAPPPPTQSKSEQQQQQQRPLDGPRPTPKALLQPANEIIHRILSECLRVTLEDSTTNEGYVALPAVRLELESEGLPALITADQFERVLVARLGRPENTFQNEAAFEYLVAVYARLQVHRAKMAGLANGLDAADVEKVNERCEMMDRAKEVLLRWAALAVDPEMQGALVVQNERGAQAGSSIIIQMLLDGVISPAFLEDFASSTTANETAATVFGPVFTGLSGRFRALPTLGSSTAVPWPPLFTTMLQLVSNKSIGPLVPTLPNFNPDVPAKLIEVASLLGPFFARLTVFPDSDPTVAANMFGSSTYGVSAQGEVDEQGVEWRGRNAGEVKMAWGNLRGIMQTLENNHQQLLSALLKKESRAQTFAYILKICTANAPRGRLQHDPQTVSSHGFLYAVYRALLRLCDPFAETQFRVTAPDPSYPLADAAWDPLMKETTRVVFDQNAADTYTTKELRATNNMVAEPQPVTSLFHLTLSLAHLGPLSTIRIYAAQIRDIQELNRHLVRMRKERDSGAWETTPQGQLNHAMLKRYEGQLDKMVAEKLASDAALLDPEYLRHVLRFLDFQMAWLLRVAAESCGGTGIPAETDWKAVMRGFNMNLGGADLRKLEEPDGRWKGLPEWYVDDVCEWYTFVTRYSLTLFEQHPIDPIVTFSMLMLMNSQLIRNPYLKAKFVDIMYSFTFPMYRDAQGRGIGRLDGVFTTNPLCKERLIEVLTKFYVDVEQTGMHSQFYDKFNIRYNINQILKCVWENADQREKMVEMARNTDFFVRFVNLLMNDTTFLLDESLNKLAEIRNLQLEMADPAFQAKPQQYRTERESTLRQDERQATSYLSLGQETLHMLQYLTSEPRIVEPFMAPEVVDRLAAMMDYNLAALVGPRCTELKVKNPERYRFDPKKLLSELVQTYLHLAHRKEFVQAVAKDGRSYHKRHFDRAAGILTRTRVLGQGMVDELMAFANEVEKALKHEVAMEEEFEDAPDEFMDPIMATLMSDPVILPTSNSIVDRTTIRSHLLSDPHDPFNRQPLKFEDIVPAVELKQKIDEWKASKLEARRNAGGATQTTDSMDTSA